MLDFSFIYRAFYFLATPVRKASPRLFPAWQRRYSTKIIRLLWKDKGLTDSEKLWYTL
ncbi:hypothetical protein CLS_25140 [[Clostridium] cf. saccharolyticum K10]|nr:hypothetical protein CLS_25140 [[Clostridium] cf. saccharolyticum K10]